MNKTKIVLLTGVAMTAFAANSLLCRMALRGDHSDAASFTPIRLVAGALFLDEAVTLRLLLAAVAVLGSIALVIVHREPAT